MVAGTYNISFFTDSRPGSTSENFNVLIDGSAVGSFTPPCDTSFTAVTTSNFTVTAGNHVLEFQGVSGGAAFLDNVGLNTVTASNLSYYNYLDVMDEFVPTILHRICMGESSGGEGHGHCGAHNCGGHQLSAVR